MVTSGERKVLTGTIVYVFDGLLHEGINGRSCAVAVLNLDDC